MASLTIDQANIIPGATITWTTDLADPVTTANLTDSQGNVLPLTSVTDNGDGTGSAVVPTLAHGAQFCLFESDLTLTVSTV
jgi:hypothetical protein